MTDKKFKKIKMPKPPKGEKPKRIAFEDKTEEEIRADLRAGRRRPSTRY